MRVLPRQTDAGGLNPGRNSHGRGEVPAVKTQDAPSSAAAPRRRPLGDLPRGATPHFPDPPGTACVPDPGAPPSVSHSPRSGGDVGPPKGGRWPQPAWRPPPPPRGPATCCRLQGPEGGEGRGGRGARCQVEEASESPAADRCRQPRSRSGSPQLGGELRRVGEDGVLRAARRSGGNEFAFLKGRNLPFTPRV